MNQMVPVIVIVEDDENLAKMYEERFKAEKFIVVLARDGEEAIQVINEEKPDMILLDLMLPKKGGIGVIQILKSNPVTKDIPVLVLTAYPQDEYKKLAMDDGATDFMSKAEVMPVKVVERVKEILAKKE